MDPDLSPPPDVALDLVHEATERVVTDAHSLSDKAVATPSALPDWSRGHVLTHLARNADALVNLFESARTGEDRPMYPSVEQRNADIAAGAARPIDAIVDDLTASHERFVAAAARVTDWSPTVMHRRGGRLPAPFVFMLRLGELEIHHTDLDVAYGFDRWPADWVTAYLPYASTELTDRAGAPIELRASDADTRVDPAAPPAHTVEGPQRSLLAWVIGRHDGNDLRMTPDGPLPILGTWR